MTNLQVVLISIGVSLFLGSLYLSAYFDKKERLEKYKELMGFIVDYNDMLRNSHNSLTERQIQKKYKCLIIEYRYDYALRQCLKWRKENKDLKNDMEKIDLSFGETVFWEMAKIQCKYAGYSPVTLADVEKAIDNFLETKEAEMKAAEPEPYMEFTKNGAINFHRSREDYWEYLKNQ